MENKTMITIKKNVSCCVREVYETVFEIPDDVLRDFAKQQNIDLEQLLSDDNGDYSVETLLSEHESFFANYYVDEDKCCYSECKSFDTEFEVYQEEERA
jgi:hypothetical protein